MANPDASIRIATVVKPINSEPFSNDMLETIVSKRYANVGIAAGKSKINNIAAMFPTITEMFTMLRYGFEQNHIKGDYLVVFKLMEELRTIAHTYTLKSPVQ